MKLYWSTPMASLAVLILAYELDIPLTLVEMDLDSRMLADGRSLAEVNPKGCMPVVERDDGSIVTETAVILNWLAAQDEAQRLTAPAHGEAYLRINEWMIYLASEIHKPATLMFWEIEASTKQAIKDRIIYRFALIEQALDGTSFLVDDRYTIADIYLVVMLGGALHLMPDFDLRGIYPNLHDLRRRVLERPATKRAMRDHGQAAAVH